jgi:hypothetical protein
MMPLLTGTTVVDKRLLLQVVEEHERMLAEMFVASMKEQLAFQRELALAMRPPRSH